MLWGFSVIAFAFLTGGREAEGKATLPCFSGVLLAVIHDLCRSSALHGWEMLQQLEVFACGASGCHSAKIAVPHGTLVP